MIDATIKKAKLTSGMSASVTYQLKKKDGTMSNFQEDCPAPVHQDLKDAFHKLGVHLGVISEIIPEDEIDDIEVPSHELLSSFSVQEFEILEHDSGVKLAGSRTLSTGKHLSLKTPGVKWGAKHPYKFVEDLGVCIESCKAELIEYLFNGKQAPDAQQELPFEEGEETPDGFDEIGEE